MGEPNPIWTALPPLPPEGAPAGAVLLFGAGGDVQAAAQSLTADGVHCHVCRSSEDLASVRNEQHFDAVVVELSGPVAAGVEVLRAFHQQPGLLAVLADVPADTARQVLLAKPAAVCVLPEEAQALLPTIRNLVRRSRLLRFIQETQQTLWQTAQAADQWQQLARQGPPEQGVQDIQWYFQYGQSQVHQLLTSLGQLSASVLSGQPAASACQFFTCPRLEAFRRALDEAVATLDKTRRAFKSKDLAVLREKLQALLDRNRN